MRAAIRTSSGKTGSGAGAALAMAIGLGCLGAGLAACGGGGTAAMAPVTPTTPTSPTTPATPTPATPTPATPVPPTAPTLPALPAPVATPVAGVSLDTHGVVVDQDGKLLSWLTQDVAYDRASFLSWDFMLNRVPNDPANGLKVYFTHSEYDPDTFAGSPWPNNPAGKNAMLAESAGLYYAYSGNRAVIDLVRTLLDHQLQFGTTPATHAWANAPWSTGRASSAAYGNDDQVEGAGVLEPDKVGELGHDGYLRMWKITGDVRYRDAAIACGDALARNVRAGNANQSPWPFRVNAQTGASLEDYSAHVIAPIRLLDELVRLNLGNVGSYAAARQTAWTWLMTYPMQTNRWAQYFEDVPRMANPFENLNQYAAGQTARYMLEYPEKNANWSADVSRLIAFVEDNFGGFDNGEDGVYYGARVISEQFAYKLKMASHTSRYGAVNAMFAAATGNAAAREKAYRSLNWATYMARNNGSVNEGPAEFRGNRFFWFTDGHGDYVRHFMLAMGAFPEWAPRAENHLVRTTSVVKTIVYAATTITYETFDAAATDVLRLARAPAGVTVGGATLAQRSDLGAAGWTFDAATGVMRIRHDAAGQVRISLGS